MSKSTTSSQRKPSSSKAVKCPCCKKDAEGTSLNCDLCSKWFHAECVDLDQTSFDVIAKLDQLLWFCPACKPTGKKLFVVDKHLCDLEKSFEEMKKDLNTKIELLTELVQTSLQNINEQKQIPSQNLVASAQNIDINKIVVDSVRDALEAEGKKTTAVLENFESANDDQILGDVTDFVVSVGFDPKSILNIRRSGPTVKSRKNGQNLPRIVKVKCDSEQSRNNLIRAVMKSADRGAVYARPDRTWQQREKLRRLNAELHEKRQAGDNHWYVDKNTYELKRNVKYMPRV